MKGIINILKLGIAVTTALQFALIAMAKQPNIVLIMADDLGIEAISCYGGESYSTPHLDKMAAEGMRFTHAYAQPLCTPTRVQIMTGKYNHRNWQAFGILKAQERTFGEMMQDFGYKTCMAGKWQLYSYDPPDYPGSEKRRGIGMHPGDAGFHEYSVFHALHTEDKGSRYANPTFLQNGKLYEDVEGVYGEDVSVDFIIDFMRRHHDEPMFIYYPMALPHGPFNPTPISEVWDADPSRRIESDVSYFKDMVEYMDALVGRLIGAIDELGLGEDTLVLFYSDNGTPWNIFSRMDGREVQGGKRERTQNGIRVPLIALWPGQIEAGGLLNSNLIDASDFVPTLAELAGHDVPWDWYTDGVSFAPQLLGRPYHGRDWAFFWFDPRPGPSVTRNHTRHVFALDKQYKVFADGRMFDIEGVGMREVQLDTDALTPDQEEAKVKLINVINGVLEPPYRR